jgi:hypothetical protein
MDHIAQSAQPKRPLQRRREWVLPALFGAVSLAGALAINLLPPASGPVAALFPPWWSGARSLTGASAAGAVVRFGWPFVVIVVPQVSHPFAVLRKNGAWALLNPEGLGGCRGRAGTGDLN